MKQLVSESEPVDWRAVRRLYEQLAPQLRRMAFLASRGGALPPDEAADVLQDFVLERLPVIARRVADGQLRKPESYIRQAFRNFVFDAIRRQQRDKKALEQFKVEPGAAAWTEPELCRKEVHRGRPSRETVAEAVDQVPESLRAVVSAYIGMVGAPRSLREMANEFGLTRYATRKAVVDGLIALALQLGGSKRLSDMETQICRLVLLEGFSVQQAGRELGTTTHQARTALARARSSMATALRA